MVLGVFGFGQRPAARLRGPIGGSERVTLAHSRVPLATDAEDAGAVAPATQVPGMTLVFRRSEEQEADLQKLLAAQQNPSSPQYHHWLTPDEFAARFGVAEEDLASTEAWLTAQGLHVDSVARSRDRITFSGTAAQAQAAFGAELRRYRVDGEIHFAPANDLSLPAGLAPMTAAVLHLSDFRPKAYTMTRDTVRPQFTAASTQQHFLTPVDIATMYNLTPLYQKNWYGLGQGVAVVGQSYVDVTSGSSPVRSFVTNLGLPSMYNITPVLVPGSGSNAVSQGDESESELDLEYVSGMAPQSYVFLVYVGANQNYSVFDSLAYAITENIAPVVSISYGTCELALSQTTLNQGNTLFEQAAAQGQTLVAASGDSGSTECARYSSGVTAAQQQALSVSFPASSPYVTAVGGTQMAPGTFAAGGSSYWQNAAGGDLPGSLLSYVPEVAWNESSTTGTAAGGGGMSSYYPRPSWQSGVPGISSSPYRLLPDISLQASSASPGFLLCTDDPYIVGQSGQGSSCGNGFKNNAGLFTTSGGTSFAAPIFAGFLAVLNQSQNSTGQGNLNPTLYGLASNSATYASVFHDITQGTNACVAGASRCPAVGQSSYSATVGYDEATGLGSVDFNALTAALPASPAAGLMATNLYLAPSLTQLNPGQSTAVTVGLSPLGVTLVNGQNYTGTISITWDGAIVGPSVVVSPPSNVSSAVSYETSITITAPTTIGTHLLTATYSGDALYGPATRTTAVVVGNSNASGSITLSAGNLSVANNSTATTQVTVTPGGGYNGRVVWSMSATAASPGAPQLSGCYSITPLLVNNASSTQLTMGVGTACGGAQPQTRIAVRGTQASLGTDRTPGRGIPAGAIYAGVAVFGVLGLGRRKRLVNLLGLAVVALFLGAGLAGCGGGGSGGSGGGNNNSAPPQTQPASYTFQLTATDSVNSSIMASTTFTLTVQ